MESGQSLSAVSELPGDSLVEERLLVRMERRSAPERLPAFAIAALRLGRDLCFAQRQGSRPLAVVIAPSRSFVAAFAGLGILECYLAGLPDGQETIIPGSHVYVVRDGGVQHGIYEGREEVASGADGPPMITVRFKGGQKLRFPDGLFPVVELDVPTKRLSRYDSVVPLPPESLFAANVLGVKDPVAYEATDDPCITIVGTKSQVSADLDVPLFTSRETSGQYFKLGSLLRVKELSKSRGHHCRLLAAANLDEEGVVQTPFVLLDGATAVMHYASLPVADETAYLVVLDPSDSGFELAINTIEQLTQFGERVTDWPSLSSDGFADVEMIVVYR